MTNAEENPMFKRVSILKICDVKSSAHSQPNDSCNAQVHERTCLEDLLARAAAVLALDPGTTSWDDVVRLLELKSMSRPIGYANLDDIRNFEQITVYKKPTTIYGTNYDSPVYQK